MRTFSCWDQFLCLAFGQLTFRESLRDLELGLRSRPEHLYHLGLRGRVCRSTLAEANEQRDWRIYADVAAVLIRQARRLYVGESFGVELGNVTAYAFDATIIDVSLGLFPWARFCPTTAAVKMNTLLDLRGSIPTFISITRATRQMSMGSTIWFSSPARSISWIAATSTTEDFFESRKPAHFSSSGPKPIWPATVSALCR